MKKIIKLITAMMIVCLCHINTIYASGGLSLSASWLNVVRGSSYSFRVTASNCYGRISISSSNTSVATISVSWNSSAVGWLDAGESATVTVRGISNGTAYINVTCVDVATGDYQDISGRNYSVGVSVYTPAPVISSDSSLSSISLGDIQLQEEFKGDSYDYTAYAPNGTTALDINVTPTNSKSTISPFENTVTEGWNEINITITAESGDTSTYHLKVYVEETPTLFYSLNDQSLGVVKNVDLVNLDGFSKETIQVPSGETTEDITLFTNGAYDLLYLKDDSGNYNYYIYDKENNNIKGIYQVTIINSNKYVVMNTNYEEFSYMNENFIQSIICINGQRFDGWVYKDINETDFEVVYLGSPEGIYQLYRYDKKEKTIQRLNYQIEENTEETPVEEEKEETFMNIPYLYWYVLIAAAGFFLLSVIILIINSARIKKAKKNNK